MIPPILNDAGDCCCQCPPNGQDGWCHCNDNYNGKGDDIENAITCDLVWTEVQANGRKKYFKVVSGSSQQNMPVVLPTASLKKRGVVQLTNELSDREDLALTPKGAKDFKSQLDKETADRIAKDTDLQNQINKEKSDRANADTDLLNKINQETTDRTDADKSLSDRITQETADRKKADSALSSSISTVSNKVTNIESKVDSAVSKANNAVTGVTSDGNATVTVTKADGTSKSFTINNVAHASSADSATTATTATNANHATTADRATKATNADHATVADRLSSGSEFGTSTVLGLPNWSKYKVVGTSLGSFSLPYTFDSNCFVTATGKITVAPGYDFDGKIKINDTVLDTIKFGSVGTGATSKDYAYTFICKKGDVISITNSAMLEPANFYLTLNILPLE